MRTIKFRAWDKNRKLMYYNVGFSGNNSFPRRIMDGEIDCLKLVTFDTAVLMQFTGLSDKNGVDIYEGDIVKHNNGITVVEYDNDNASFQMSLNDFVLDQEIGYEGIEVIGNIHEHGNLLDK